MQREYRITFASRDSQVVAESTGNIVDDGLISMAVDYLNNANKTDVPMNAKSFEGQQREFEIRTHWQDDQWVTDIMAVDRGKHIAVIYLRQHGDMTEAAVSIADFPEDGVSLMLRWLDRQLGSVLKPQAALL